MVDLAIFLSVLKDQKIRDAVVALSRLRPGLRPASQDIVGFGKRPDDNGRPRTVQTLERNRSKPDTRLSRGTG